MARYDHETQTLHDDGTAGDLRPTLAPAVGSQDPTFEVEVLFHSSGTPFRCQVTDEYVKQDALCISLPDGTIRKFPLCNVFSWAKAHGPHAGSRHGHYRPGGIKSGC
jgi:hypothetical protein